MENYFSEMFLEKLILSEFIGMTYVIFIAFVLLNSAPLLDLRDRSEYLRQRLSQVGKRLEEGPFTNQVGTYRILTILARSPIVTYICGSGKEMLNFKGN